MAVFPHPHPPPSEKESEEGGVASHRSPGLLDFCAVSDFCWSVCSECRLSLNPFPVITALYVTSICRRPQAPHQNGKPGTYRTFLCLLSVACWGGGCGDSENAGSPMVWREGSTHARQGSQPSQELQEGVTWSVVLILQMEKMSPKEEEQLIGQKSRTKRHLGGH